VVLLKTLELEKKFISRLKKLLIYFKVCDIINLLRELAALMSKNCQQDTDPHYIKSCSLCQGLFFAVLKNILQATSLGEKPPIF